MSIVAGFLGGLGAGLVKAGEEAQKQWGQKELQEENHKLQRELQENMIEFNRGEHAANRAVTISENEKSRELTRSEGRDTRAQQLTLTREQLAQARQLHADSLANALAIADRHEKAASGRHAESMKFQREALSQGLTLAEMQAPMQQAGDGTFFKMNAKGEMVYITDPVTREKVKGAKDLSQRELKAAEAVLVEMKLVANDQMKSPDDKKSEITSLKNQLSVILNPPKEGAPAPAAAVPKDKNGRPFQNGDQFMKNGVLHIYQDGKEIRADDASRNAAVAASSTTSTTQNPSTGIVSGTINRLGKHLSDVQERRGAEARDAADAARRLLTGQPN